MAERTTRFPDIDKHLSEMRVLQRHASAHHGFLSYLVTHQKETSEKYVGSYTGNLIKLQIDSVVSAAVMLVCSLWDKNGHSLPEFAKAIEDKHSDIEAQRRSWCPDWDDEMLGLDDLNDRISKFQRKIAETKASQKLSAIKVHRDEEIAHPLRGRSGQRRQHDRAYGAYEPAQYNDLIDVLNDTATLVSDATSIWHFDLIKHSQVSEMYEKYSKTYWKNLPEFSKVEVE